MRIESPIAAALALEAERLPVSGQQQFDRGGIEADSMIERGDAVMLINAANHQHSHQYLQLRDVARIAGEERFDRERPVGNDDEVHPRAGNVDARHLIAQLVDLSDDDAVSKSRGLADS